MISELRRKALPFQGVLRRMTWSIQSCMLGLKDIGFYSSLTSSNCNKRNVAKWQSLFLETASHEKKTKKKHPCFLGRTKLTVFKSGQKVDFQKTHLFILNKNPTSNLSDLIFDLLPIIFRNNYNIKIMEKHLCWQHDAVRNCKPPKKNCRNEISCRCVFYLRRIIFSYILLLVTSKTPRVTTTFHSRWSFLSAFFFCRHGPLVRALVFEFHRVKLATWPWCLQLEVFALA